MVGGMKRLGEGDNGGSSQMDMMDGPSSDEDSQVYLFQYFGKRQTVNYRAFLAPLLLRDSGSNRKEICSSDKI